MDVAKKVDMNIVHFIFRLILIGILSIIVEIITYPFLETCEDTNADGAKDVMGMSCHQYELLDLCKKSESYKDEDFDGSQMCCTCKGGSTRRGKYTLETKF